MGRIQNAGVRAQGGERILVGTAIKSSVALIVAAFLIAASSVALGQKVKGPLSVDISAIRVQGNSVEFKVKCTGHSPFTDGCVVLQVNLWRSKNVDTIQLWKGSSDDKAFDKTLTYNLQLVRGKKAKVAAIFRGRVAGLNRPYTTTGELSVFQLEDTLLQAHGSYEWLDRTESEYLIMKKGYESKSEEEIRAIDPRFWKRIEHLRHGRGVKVTR